MSKGVKLVKLKGNILEYTINDFKNNENIVLEAIKQNSKALEYASINLKNNKKIILASIITQWKISLLHKYIFFNH